MSYIPDRGDIVILDFNPAIGREQKGRRPALILTSASYNKFGVCYAMPVTSKTKGYRIEIKLEKTKKILGVILSNQMKALDWTERNVEYIETVDEDILNEVDIRLRTIFGL